MGRHVKLKIGMFYVLELKFWGYDCDQHPQISIITHFNEYVATAALMVGTYVGTPLFSGDRQHVTLLCVLVRPLEEPVKDDFSSSKVVEDEDRVFETSDG